MVIWGLVLGLAITLGGPSYAASAPTYLRVTKNGVIYYYFSDRAINREAGELPVFKGLSKAPSFRGQPKIALGQIDSLIEEVSRRYRMPPTLIKALIKVESNFNPHAVSPKGAQGLMQLMPETAQDLGVANPFDLWENIWAGTRYLCMLLQKFNYRLPLALAAYNAGPQRVAKAQQVPSIPETHYFVQNVCATFLKLEGEKSAR